jgi:ribosomal protein S18 acetylase RimI-like enzyme
MTDIIRHPSKADKPAIRQIVEATGMFPGDMLDDMMSPYFEGHPDELWFVVGEPAYAVAYAVPERLTNGTWNQLLIAVNPAVQRTGIGKALMRNLEAVAEERGARLVIVETSGVPEFEETRTFYRSIGYKEEGRIRDFYDDGDDKVIFSRKAIN